VGGAAGNPPASRINITSEAVNCIPPIYSNMKPQGMLGAVNRSAEVFPLCSRPAVVVRLAALTTHMRID
jgi:hypothetical protein